MITGVVLAHNEELNIVRCLRQLRPHVSEVILIDTSSTDRTVDLARPLIDELLTHSNVPNFDSLRNLAIPVAKFDWLWFVDADEFVSEATGQLVRSWIQDRGDEFEAINIPFKSQFCGQWMQHCGWWPGYTCPRVLKRGYFRFSDALHGGVELHGRQVLTPATAETGIEHQSSRDLEHWITKFNRYTTTEALQLADAGVVYDWRGAIRYMVRDLWEHYEKFDAQQDGERGWILTWCAGLYRWASVAKLVDLGRSPGQLGGESSLPASLDEVIDAMRDELAVFRKKTPSFPVGVVVRAPYWGTSIGAAEARDWIIELAGDASRVVVCEPSPSDGFLEVAPEHRCLLNALQRSQRARSVVTVTFADPTILPPDRGAFYNILRLGREIDIGSEDATTLTSYDEIWLANAGQVSLLRELGCAGERLKQVPLATAPNQEEPLVANCECPMSIRDRIDSWEHAQRPEDVAPPSTNQMRICVEGEFFNGHSFSNINELLSERFIGHPDIALTLSPVRYQEGSTRHNVGGILSYFERDLGGPPHVTIRHAYPPNWDHIPDGLWVHIQPWEFGMLPRDWIAPLRDRVDEIWVMSRYVERVYLDSGISREKVHYIPWGVDPAVFRSDSPARHLPNVRSFRFLYAGGIVDRKGFDRVLTAYLQEFRSDEDVCLVVKAVGVRSFYQSESLHEEILAAQRDSTNPQILYVTDEYQPTQLASLYAACHCVVSAYRGEGFGLPILEAMACGLAAIVPRGGPTDDFVDDKSGYFLSAQEVPAEGVKDVCGPPTEFDVSIDEIRSKMRYAYANQQQTKEAGRAGSLRVRAEFTWQRTVDLMIERLRSLTATRTNESSTCTRPIASAVPTSQEASAKETICLHGRLGKSILIQMACGPHLELLDLVRSHHRDYATRFGLDYWDISGLPAYGKRPGWGKVSLILAAITMGYDQILWLDADAVIRRPEVNLTTLIESGIGMVRHPSPDHWNTGMIISKSSPDVERFWREVDTSPENKSSWMEQEPVNQLAAQPRFAKLFQSLDLRFNSVPGFACAADPVIIAGHGAPLQERKRILEAGLRETRQKVNSSLRHIASRSDLPLLFNELSLTGDGVEVGVHRGEFAEQLLERWNGRTLHLVDPWRKLPNYDDIANVDDAEHEANFHQTCARLVHFGDRVRIHRSMSLDAARHFGNGTLDFAYLDANHSFDAVWQDLNAWFPKVRQGGILAGHDFLDGKLPEGDFGVASAVKKFSARHGLAISLTDDAWQSWYLQIS